MRTIKTALAVTLCIIISKLFNVTTAFYACIAAVISMENTVSYSYRAGLNRMLGTILGALVGLIFSLIRPGNALLAGLGIVIVIALCNQFKWKKSITIACTVFCIIMVNLNGRNPLEYSIVRALDTLLGIVVSIVVNYTIYPPKINEKLHNEYLNIKSKIFDVAKEQITNPDLDSENLNAIKKSMVKLEDLIKACDEEFSTFRYNGSNMKEYVEFLDEIKKIVIYMEMISTLNVSYLLDEENIEEFNRVFQCDNCYYNQGEGSLSDDENIVYNYNVKSILKHLELIKNSNIYIVRE